MTVSGDRARSDDDCVISVVVALHNEQECLAELVPRLTATLSRARCPFEIILVDDGSTDASFEVIEEIAARDARVRGVRLSRNEGQKAALLCGMELARGDVVVTLDADLQHPPELIIEMLAAWRRGYDVVHMRRQSSQPESPAREALTAAFYRLFNALSDVRVSPRSTDFRLLDRRCVAALLALSPSGRLLRAMARRIGFRQTELSFDAPARFAGTSSYTLRKLFALGADAVLTSSRLPVFMPLSVGAASLAVGAGCAVAIAAGSPASPALAIAAAGALILGLSLLSIGLLGAHIARLVAAAPGRPLYFIERTVGGGVTAPLLNRALGGDEQPRFPSPRDGARPPAESALH